MASLIQALKLDQFELAAQLIESDNLTDERDELGFAPLHIATLKQQVELARMLLVAGADPNAKNDIEDVDPPSLKNITCNEQRLQQLFTELKNLGNKTPLHIATKDGCLEIASLLLKFGANVNIVDSGLCTPLHWCATSGNLALVKLLLQHHADPNIQDLAYSTPLHEAIRNQHIQVVQWLLKFQADPSLKDVMGCSAQELAAQTPMAHLFGPNPHPTVNSIH